MPMKIIETITAIKLLWKKMRTDGKSYLNEVDTKLVMMNVKD
jgi:hypothetical protein